METATPSRCLRERSLQLVVNFLCEFGGWLGLWLGMGVYIGARIFLAVTRLPGWMPVVVDLVGDEIWWRLLVDVVASSCNNLNFELRWKIKISANLTSMMIHRLMLVVLSVVPFSCPNGKLRVCIPVLVGHTVSVSVVVRIVAVVESCVTRRWIV